MTYGKDNGKAVFTLSNSETTQFELGTPIIKRTAYRKGIVEIEVKRRTVCPSLETLDVLRHMIANPAIKGAAKFTVNQALATVEGYKVADTHFVDVRNDLKRFIETIDGSVPISELV